METIKRMAYGGDIYYGSVADKEKTRTVTIKLNEKELMENLDLYKNKNIFSYKIQFIEADKDFAALIKRIDKSFIEEYSGIITFPLAVQEHCCNLEQVRKRYFAEEESGRFSLLSEDHPVNEDEYYIAMLTDILRHMRDNYLIEKLDIKKHICNFISFTDPEQIIKIIEDDPRMSEFFLMCSALAPYSVFVNINISKKFYFEFKPLCVELYGVFDITDTLTHTR